MGVDCRVHHGPTVPPSVQSDVHFPVLNSQYPGPWGYLCRHHLPPLLRPICIGREFLSLPFLSPAPHSFHVCPPGSILKWPLSTSPRQLCPPCSLAWPTPQPLLPGFPPRSQMELLHTLGFCFGFMPCRRVEPWTLCVDA